MNSLAYIEETDHQAQANEDIEYVRLTGGQFVDDSREGSNFIKGIISASLISIPVWSLLIGLFVWMF